MIGELLSGLVDKKKLIKNYIENTIEDVSEELGIKPKELFIMIKPTEDASNEFVVYLYKIVLNSSPVKVRTMELKEFVNE